MTQTRVLRGQVPMLLVIALIAMVGLVIGGQDLEASAARGRPVPSVLPSAALNSRPTSYRWDGWQTDYQMTGGYARLTVIPARGVLPHTQDFVAVRMMAKVRGPGGVGDRWLEIGYVTSGMTDGGVYVYTFDTGSDEWHFYPQYPLRENMQIRVGLFNSGPVWDAWLYYDHNWFKLATVAGPGQEWANFEYYVETHHAQGDSNHVHIWAPTYDQVIDDEMEPARAR